MTVKILDDFCKLLLVNIGGGKKVWVEDVSDFKETQG